MTIVTVKVSMKNFIRFLKLSVSFTSVYMSTMAIRGCQVRYGSTKYSQKGITSSIKQWTT